MLLSDYIGIGNELDLNGVFDPVLNEDSHFFINLQRLKKTDVPEFVKSYEKIHDYFRKIIKLLDKAEKKTKKDTFYRQALRMFNFSEVNGICLGYAKGTTGAGFGRGLSEQVISNAFDIVKAGIVDPEFFELLPLFQDNVGADRLSDMIATLIIDDIKNYTKRINEDLGINHTKYKRFHFNGEFLINPYKHDDILLVPVDILHRLPVAESWEDIDLVVSQNTILRAEINYEVASEWRKYSAYERKAYLRHEIFTDREACQRILAGYRNEELDIFDPKESFPYFLKKLDQMIKNMGIKWVIEREIKDSYDASMEIIAFFRHWVEDLKGWEHILGVDSRNREKVIQRVIHGQALAFIEANRLDISCEPNEGRGPVDFKISRGDDKTIIEVKLSSSNQYLHGYEVQIEEYGKAERTDQMIYVLIDLGHPLKIKKILELHDKRYNDGEDVPTLIVIDSTEKKSASRA